MDKFIATDPNDAQRIGCPYYKWGFRLMPDSHTDVMPDAVPVEAGRHSDVKPDG